MPPGGPRQRPKHGLLRAVGRHGHVCQPGRAVLGPGRNTVLWAVPKAHGLHAQVYPGPSPNIVKERPIAAAKVGHCKVVICLSCTPYRTPTGIARAVWLSRAQYTSNDAAARDQRRRAAGLRVPRHSHRASMHA